MAAKWRQIADSSKETREGHITVSPFVLRRKAGAPGGIRTHDPRFRRPMLYPLSYGRGDSDRQTRYHRLRVHETPSEREAEHDTEEDVG